MADFSIKVDPSLERYVAKLLQMPTYKPVVDRLVEEATKRRDEAIESWPVARRFRDGQPTPPSLPTRALLRLNRETDPRES